jgi:hypothetical protein
VPSLKFLCARSTAPWASSSLPRLSGVWPASSTSPVVVASFVFVESRYRSGGHRSEALNGFGHIQDYPCRVPGSSMELASVSLCSFCRDQLWSLLPAKPLSRRVIPRCARHQSSSCHCSLIHATLWSVSRSPSASLPCPGSSSCLFPSEQCTTFISVVSLRRPTSLSPWCSTW